LEVTHERLRAAHEGAPLTRTEDIFSLVAVATVSERHNA
jgi:hypothetical protein